MGLNPKLLGNGEYEVRHLRTHAKAIVVPIIVFIILSALLGMGLALSPNAINPWGQLAVTALYLVLVIWWCLLPVIRWATTTYTLTNRRIITRRGIITKTGHDLPLNRINDVSYQRSLSDRLFGCGTLVLTTASESPVVVHDIPDVERVHVQMTELLFGPEGHHLNAAGADSPEYDRVVDE